ATVTAGRLEVPSLKLAATENPDLPRSVSVGPVRGLKVALQYAGGKPVGEATIVAPFVRAGDWSATDLSTHAVLLDDRLRLQNLRAQALGGKIAAEGLLLTKKPGDGVRLRGTARGLELARIPPLHGVDLPDDLTGSVDADFQARLTGRRLTAVASFEARGVRAEGVTADTATGTVGVEGEGTLSGVGRVTASGITHERLSLDQAEALVRFEGRRLDVLSATAQSPLGTVWARGDVDLDGKTLALQVQGANLDLAPLAEPADLEDLGGRAYVSGDLTGAFDAPVFTGRLSVFDPRAGEYALSAATAQARYADKQLVLTDLLATQGSGILSGNVTLGNLQPGDSKHVTLAGRLVGEGLDLQEIVKLLKRDEPLSGLAEFDATLSGTVGQPQAAGHVRLANATYNDFVVTQADAPFTWADDRLAVSQGHATVLDAPVQVTGTLTLREPNELEAFLSAGDVPLEGLSPYLKSDLPIAGRASVERAWVRGPLKDLQGGARLTAQEVRVGDETIGDLNASLTLSRGQLQLQETSFALANGRVIVSGAYNTASEPQTVAAQVQLLQTEVPDLLQLAVPLASAADKRPAEERGRLLTTLRSYALRVKGAVDGTVNLSGPINAPAAAVDLAGEHLVLDGRTLPQIKTTARLTKDAVQDLVFAARQGDALINADGDIVFDGPINLNVEGTGIAMSLLRPWVPLQTSFGGQLGFTVVAEGLTREPEVMASVDIAAPSFAGVQFDVLSVPIATVREGQVDVDTLTVKRGETEIVLDGRLPFSWHLPGASGEHPGLIPDGQITMGGRIEKTPLAFFLPLVDEYTRGLHPPAPTPTAEEGFRWASLKTEGAVDSAVSLTGTVRTPTVRGYLKLDGGKVSPPKWTQAASDLNADLQFSGTGRTNLVEIKRLAGRYDQTQGELTGRVELTSVAPRDFWRNVMDLRLGLSADKQAVPGGSELSALHGALRLQTEDGVQVLRPEDLRLNVGGGEAELTGEARLRTFRVARLADNQFDLHFKMAPGRVRYQPYLDAMGHGNLDLVTPPGQSRARLTGNIQLTDGIIGLVAPAAGLDTFAAVSSALPSPDLDLIAGLGEGVQLRGSAVKAPLLPNDAAARITGTPQQPRLVGNVAAGRGTTMLPTSTLRLKSLFVDYVVEPLPGDRSDPQTL
ncbi:MAG: hypothetical protein KKI08_15955, partial [Armatimonadetes bacterium]|nr:hypothetical protein [Armatimonadota bacterium]